MKLQLLNIISKINKKKLEPAFDCGKAEKDFTSFISYNSSKAFERESKRGSTKHISAVIFLEIVIHK
jgi:hypothetical protein